MPNYIKKNKLYYKGLPEDYLRTGCLEPIPLLKLVLKGGQNRLIKWRDMAQSQ